MSERQYPPDTLERNSLNSDMKPLQHIWRGLIMSQSDLTEFEMQRKMREYFHNRVGPKNTMGCSIYVKREQKEEESVKKQKKNKPLKKSMNKTHVKH